jgi:hypothetical protein
MVLCCTKVDVTIWIDDWVKLVARTVEMSFDQEWTGLQ